MLVNRSLRPNVQAVVSSIINHQNPSANYVLGSVSSNGTSQKDTFPKYFPREILYMQIHGVVVIVLAEYSTQKEKHLFVKFCVHSELRNNDYKNDETQ